MQKALATFGWDAAAPLLDLALPTFRDYADRHGYQLIVSSRRCDRPASWCKIPLLQDLLACYGFVLWIDADALILDASTDLAAVIPDDAYQAFVVCNCGDWADPPRTQVRRGPMSPTDPAARPSRGRRRRRASTPEDHGLLGRQPQTVRDRRGGIEVQTCVGERVGRDIDHDIGETQVRRETNFTPRVRGTTRDEGFGLPCCGIWALRAVPRTEELLNALWSQEDFIGVKGWEQSALMRLMGWTLEWPYFKARASEWDAGTHVLGEEWDALPIFPIRYRPARIRHYAGMPYPEKLYDMQTDAAKVNGRLARYWLGQFERRVLRARGIRVYDRKLRRAPRALRRRLRQAIDPTGL